MDVLQPGATTAPGWRLPAGANLELAGQPSGKGKGYEVDWLSHSLTRIIAIIGGSSLKTESADCRGNYVL